MDTVKVHVAQDNYISCSCPYCERTYRISVANFKEKRHQLITRCKCGKRFKMHLNFRRFYRKKVDIVGSFIYLSSDSGQWFTATVINLSMSGLRLKTDGKTGIKKDDKLRVKFKLDIKRTPTLDKEVVVRHVGDGQYGCEFIDLAYEEKDLGFYLF